MSVRAALTYLVLVVPSLLVAAVVWSAVVSGRLYYCWDSVPVFDFVPPFVHADASGAGVGDHYIVAPWIVHATWALFLVAALSLPLAITRRAISGTHAFGTPTHVA